MINKQRKLQIVFDLNHLSQRAFIYKLRSQIPGITEEQINEKVKSWWLDRPGAPDGDADGIIGDISRFFNEDKRNT